MDTRRESKEYARIAEGLIETEPVLEMIKTSRVKIGYLASEHEMRSGGRTIFGQCEKVPEKYRWAIPYDFTVTFFEPNVERFTEKQLEILMLHELMHVGIRMDGNEEKYKITPHDIEDFGLILRRYGVDWNEPA